MYYVRSSGGVVSNYYVNNSYGYFSPGTGSSGGGTCPNRSGMVENVGYMNDVAISYGNMFSGHELQ